MARSNRLPAFLSGVLKHFTEGCAAYGLAMYPICADPSHLADVLPEWREREKQPLNLPANDLFADNVFAGADLDEERHRAAKQGVP